MAKYYPLPPKVLSVNANIFVSMLGREIIVPLASKISSSIITHNILELPKNVVKLILTNFKLLSMLMTLLLAVFTMVYIYMNVTALPFYR